MKYKCFNCSTIVEEVPCPVCHNEEKTSIKPMCELDHVCHCADDVTSGMRVCPICGEFICPCGSHDVILVSRVTGYLSDVAGWGKGKRQELKDRVRYNRYEI